MNRPSKLLSVLTSISTAVFLLSGAIAVPILWRGWYYLQADALGLSAATGFSPDVIRGAFDAVMDNLVKGAPFGTGQLAWSESGMSHFADCRDLFRLDFLLLAVSALVLLVVAALVLGRKVRLHRFLGRSACFWGTAALAAVLLIALVWALADFEGLFTAFHTAFFPGKDNWLLDERTDQIILILPEAFWARTAALVAAAALAGGALLTGLTALLRRALAPKSVYDALRRERR